MNEVSVNIPVLAFWWRDAAFRLGVYLSVATSGDRLLPRGVVTVQTHIHTQTHTEGSQVLTSPQSLASSIFFIFASLIGVKWYLTAVLFCITQGNLHSSWAWWSLGFCPLKVACSYILSTLLWWCHLFAVVLRNGVTIRYTSRANISIGTSWNSVRLEWEWLPLQYAIQQPWVGVSCILQLSALPFLLFCHLSIHSVHSVLHWTEIFFFIVENQ